MGYNLLLHFLDTPISVWYKIICLIEVIDPRSWTALFCYNTYCIALNATKNEVKVELEIGTTITKCVNAIFTHSVKQVRNTIKIHMYLTRWIYM